MAFRLYFSAFLLWILTIGSVQAIVLTHSGADVDISINNDFDGTYLDFTDPNDATAYSYSTSSTEPLSWGINPFFGGAAIATSDTFEPVTISTTTNSDIVNLAFGATVGPSSTFPTGFSGSSGHMGTNPDEFEGGTSGYMGFALVDGSDYYYGWMEVTLEDDGATGVIHEWAWNTVANEAITVGAVPEPASAAMLLGLGSMLWVGSRRRKRMV